MPIYEYECRGCRHQFEALVLSTTPAAACPMCKKRSLKQLISLCASSSDATREASLSAAHKKAASVRKEKGRAEHRSLHQHFEDTPRPKRAD